MSSLIPPTKIFFTVTCAPGLFESWNRRRITGEFVPLPSTTLPLYKTHWEDFSSDSQHTSLETARFGSTTLPSTLCGRADMAASTSCTEEYVTKPKPLDLLVLGSLMTYRHVSFISLIVGHKSHIHAFKIIKNSTNGGKRSRAVTFLFFLKGSQ